MTRRGVPDGENIVPVLTNSSNRVLDSKQVTLCDKADDLRR